ncbi:unnamed protein product [Rotaria socialis]|uniref:Haloacid dehalogenase-like hydrolase domain-containing 5 n=1 Tax=Rotaria socialis TaxID=392032 RepID=A0A820WNY0_9BILA|nr:unnamed protein product [Rotaria socialis]
MPTDTTENSTSSISMTTVNDSNNNGSSLITTTANHTPSPPLSSSLPTQTLTTNRSISPTQIPSRQLDKLRCFLSTLYYFGSDISNDIGEHVRALILALVNSALSVEEFHGKLQATTNFPLRPFALPFLKSTLPLLQTDLLQLARQARQSTSQFIAQHEELIFLSRDALENESNPAKEQLNENGKRKLSNDSNELDERSYATKRPSVNHRTNTTSIRDKERAFSSYLREYTMELKDTEDDWKHAENMLNYILEMVTKSKRVLFMLQQKDIHLRRLIESTDLEWRRRHAELVAQTDDRIADVRRKAGETVLEIKRQSIIDLQKAISQTEQKSNETLLREREQYQRLKAHKFEEAYALLNRQEDGPEHCWNCGRKAIEACSGCNIARYCGQYCQHRDWDLHKKLCGPDLKRRFNDNSRLFCHSIPKTISLNQHNDESIARTTDNVLIPPMIRNDNEKSESENDHVTIPQFGLLFDIDGVLTRGRKLLPYTRDAFRNLVKANGEFRIPTLFVTNAGNELRLSKAAKLTQILGISILPEQVILSHSPLKLFSEFHTKHCLISGQGPIAEIAKNLGFTKVTTIEQLSDAFPNLDMVDHKKRRGFHSPFRDYFLPIEAVVLFGEPVKWEACLQLIIDVLMTNGNPSSPIVRAPVSHLPILASNADLLWMAEAALPRFGHGSFLHCLENLYEKISGHQLQYTTIVGKPSEVTFYHAEYLISRHAHELGLKQPIKRLYVVGDNPDTDVYGANVYNRYLQRRSLSRVNQIVSQTTIGTLTSSGKNISGKNLWSSSNSAEPAADNIEQYYTAESLESILVCTGVFNRETYDETLGKNHGHRDMFIDAELRKPKHTCEHVLDAVKLIFDIEQFR